MRHNAKKRSFQHSLKLKERKRLEEWEKEHFDYSLGSHNNTISCLLTLGLGSVLTFNQAMQSLISHLLLSGLFSITMNIIFEEKQFLKTKITFQIAKGLNKFIEKLLPFELVCETFWLSPSFPIFFKPICFHCGPLLPGKFHKRTQKEKTFM